MLYKPFIGIPPSAEYERVSVGVGEAYDLCASTLNDPDVTVDPDVRCWLQAITRAAQVASVDSPVYNFPALGDECTFAEQLDMLEPQELWGLLDEKFGEVGCMIESRVSVHGLGEVVRRLIAPGGRTIMGGGLWFETRSGRDIDVRHVVGHDVIGADLDKALSGQLKRFFYINCSFGTDEYDSPAAQDNRKKF